MNEKEIFEIAKSCINDALPPPDYGAPGAWSFYDNELALFAVKMIAQGRKAAEEELELARLHIDKLTEGRAEELKHEFERGRKAGMEEAAEIAEETRMFEGGRQESYVHNTPWEFAAAIRQRIEGDYLHGARLVVDHNTPSNTAVFKDQKGRIVGTIINIED